jgi:dolichol-phosphate mannosyltransferase
MTKLEKQTMVSIVLPSFRKEYVIQETLTRLYSELTIIGLNQCEVIVVVDGESDNSLAVLYSLKYKNLKVISYEKNQGKGYAVRKGWQASSGKFIGYIDCDLDIHPGALNYAIGILSGNQEISGVIGSKWISWDNNTYPLMRRAASLFYRFISRNLLSLNVSDTQTGLKLFRGEVAQYLLNESSMNGFAWDLEICAIAAKKGLALEEIPINLSHGSSRDKSSIKFNTALQAFLDILIIRKKMKRIT